MLQGISNIHPIFKRQRAMYWRRIDSRKVFIRSFVRSYYYRPFYSFILIILPLDSSSSEQLLKSMESCETQTKQANHLQTQCALLNEKVHNRMQKLTEKENAESIVKKTGADPGFFLGGGALVSCSTSTPINHIVFFVDVVFFAEYQLYQKTAGHLGGGGVRTPCTLPLDRLLENKCSSERSGFIFLLWHLYSLAHSSLDNSISRRYSKSPKHR